MNPNNESKQTLQMETDPFWDFFEISDKNIDISTNLTLDNGVRDHTSVLVIYGVLFVVGALGNLVVLTTLATSRRRRSRVDLLMTHLAVADVCVTCGVIPLEIGWKCTNAWLAGNLLCKLLLVVRPFGLYLSSNVLVCISVDRFFAVIYPLRLPVARRRSKQMLWMAWLAALACSFPQSIVFSVKRHPQIDSFEQCVSFDAFGSTQLEVAYNVFCVCAMYFVPLVVITSCYLCIFSKIHKNSQDIEEKHKLTTDMTTNSTNGLTQVRLRRSDKRMLERARRRTLRMTVTIVAVFALCWLPYATMAMWYMIDRQSAARVSPKVQDLLFAMAVSNSCMNPLVYGTYALNLKGKLSRLLKKFCCLTSAGSDRLEISGSSSCKNKQPGVEVPFLKHSKSRTRLGVRFAETSLTGVAVAERMETSSPRRSS